MNQRQTSLDAFKEIKEDGTLGKMQEIILAWFNAYPQSTDKEISELSGHAINTVTARRNELVTKGYLIEYNRRPCIVTKRKAITWCIPKLWNTKLKHPELIKPN